METTVAPGPHQQSCPWSSRKEPAPRPQKHTNPGVTWKHEPPKLAEVKRSKYRGRTIFIRIQFTQGQSVELGSIAELASAAAGGTGTILSIFALSYARGANATAEQTRLDMKEDAEKNREIASEREKKLDLKQSEVDRRESDREDREKKRVEDEIAREKRNMAGSLQAWWAKHGDDWGVIVSNRGPAATVFHDVAIRCTGNHYGTAITFETFPLESIS